MLNFTLHFQTHPRHHKDQLLCQFLSFQVALFKSHHIKQKSVTDKHLYFSSKSPENIFVMVCDLKKVQNSTSADTQTDTQTDTHTHTNTHRNQSQYKQR